MAGETSPPPPARDSKSPSSSPKPKSPAAEKSPSPANAGSPQPTTIAGILPAQHWVDAAEGQGFDDADDASAVVSSTASLSASILEYRKIHGRTYHHDNDTAKYWGSNDSQQNESMDINHHVETLLSDGKLFLAPLDTDKVHKVLDIGTGTGSWAIDFADDHPNAEVVGTDMSPIQPTWIPPNLKFEIEDCTLEWTFAKNSVDYIHMRLLIGSIADWDFVFKQAYETLAPGGWFESQENNAVWESDDDTLSENSALGQWGKLFANFGNTIGRSFSICDDGLQRKAMEAAGFVDIHEVEYKDTKLKEIGEYTQVALEADIEGYILYPATSLGWSREEVAIFAAHIRREIRSPDIHSYYRQKVVYGRKPS
ncbi:related to TAM domain methyltransferase [Cephalotrichum gorgonifer]|uniref:Related to TAM domain methyltransferase n=1 Tax=Cephalotrichum gorgonifer TaxID=2041049 RepID=A0AAE8MN96_9PEZI|nr:related to TAM domain methyltransferase [Cephalotrichum gorgonifer]